MLLAAYQGRQAEASDRPSPRTPATRLARGEGLGLHHANWATAILYNGLGRYAEALAAAEQATEEDYAPLVTACALPELIEAAARAGTSRTGRRGAAAAVGNDRRWFRLGRRASRRARGHCSATAATPSSCYARGGGTARTYTAATRARPRPPAVRRVAPPPRTGGPTPATNCAPPTSCSPPSAPMPSPSAHAESCSPPARRSASGRPTPRASLTPQEEHIARLARDGRTNPRSARSCSSAPVPSNGTSARCSSNWASPPARVSTTPCPSGARRRHRASRTADQLCPRRERKAAASSSANS